MKFTFKVYYRDGTEENTWKIAEKFKLISANSKKAAEEKFRKKYPYYIPIYVA